MFENAFVFHLINLRFKKYTTTSCLSPIRPFDPARLLDATKRLQSVLLCTSQSVNNWLHSNIKLHVNTFHCIGTLNLLWNINSSSLAVLHVHCSNSLLLPLPINCCHFVSAYKCHNNSFILAVIIFGNLLANNSHQSLPLYFSSIGSTPEQLF